MASAKAEQVTKEKPSFVTETTMPACRSLSKIPFNSKQLLLHNLYLIVLSEKLNLLFYNNFRVRN
jgi:hypothetical protein